MHDDDDNWGEVVRMLGGDDEGIEPPRVWIPPTYAIEKFILELADPDDHPMNHHFFMGSDVWAVKEIPQVYEGAITVEDGEDAIAGPFVIAVDSSLYVITKVEDTWP